MDVKYHEHAKPAIAKPAGRPLQRKIAPAVGYLRPRSDRRAADKTDLLVTSLERLLLLSMLLDAGALPPRTRTALRERYVLG